MRLPHHESLSILESSLGEARGETSVLLPALAHRLLPALAHRRLVLFRLVLFAARSRLALFPAVLATQAHKVIQRQALSGVLATIRGSCLMTFM